MDQRFVRVWEAIDERRRAGESLQSILRDHKARELTAALAGVGDRDPLAANAIATELLNRQARAPFLGVFIASSVFFFAIFILDALFTETPFWQLGEARRRGYALAALAVSTAAVSGIMYCSWRGWLRMPARVAHRLRRENY